MDNRQFNSGGETNGREQGKLDDAWLEILARSVAHLAAQLTMTQLRLRALATEIAEQNVIDKDAVQARLRELAAQETGRYLRENLGEALTELIDVERLEADIIEFLS
ncbi:MAG TPA: hypothetical protein VIL01_11640 [Thermomicrobiales bacterium]|jgi:hypothetical protein